MRAPATVAGVARFVLLHGFGGVGPDHWLVWLSMELRRRGHVARLRKLPVPNDPRPEAWRAALDERLQRMVSDDPDARDEKGDPAGDLVVVAHSLATRLWLQHATRDTPSPVMADRVALVVPPELPEHDALPEGAWRLELERVRPELVARSTRVVVSDNDPYWPAAGAIAGIAEPLGLPVDRLGAAGHVEPPEGYGPWPAMLAWCLGEREELAP